MRTLLNPKINSYKRFGTDTLAPWLIDWGLDNRSAMVRIPPERGPGARMEVRLGDATANPYLAMAAIGAAVYLGIQDKVEPPPKLEGYGYDAGKAEMLPLRLADALDALAADSELAGVLGGYFVDSFLRFKPNQIQRVGRVGPRWAVRAVRHRLGVPRVRLPPLRRSSGDRPASPAWPYADGLGPVERSVPSRESRSNQKRAPGISAATISPQPSRTSRTAPTLSIPLLPGLVRPRRSSHEQLRCAHTGTPAQPTGSPPRRNSPIFACRSARQVAGRLSPQAAAPVAS